MEQGEECVFDEKAEQEQHSPAIDLLGSLLRREIEDADEISKQEGEDQPWD